MIKILFTDLKKHQGTQGTKRIFDHAWSLQPLSFGTLLGLLHIARGYLSSLANKLSRYWILLDMAQRNVCWIIVTPLLNLKGKDPISCSKDHSQEQSHPSAASMGWQYPKVYPGLQHQKQAHDGQAESPPKHNEPISCVNSCIHVMTLFMSM